MRWSMTFDGKGRLIKVGHSPADLLKISVQNPPLVDQLGNPRLSTSAKVTISKPSVPLAQAQQPAPPPEPRVASFGAPD